MRLDPEIYAFFHKYFDSKSLVNFNIIFSNSNEANLYLEQGATKLEFKKIDIEEMER